jgi:hypothetical protein
MKIYFYKFILAMIFGFAVLVGIVKGQEAKQKWLHRRKIKYEAKLGYQKIPGNNDQIVLDEIEMSTYHS